MMELQKGSNKVAKAPYPFRASVIVSTFRGSKVITVLQVIIVRTVVPVRWIQCFHSNRTTKNLVGHVNSSISFFGVEQLRCHTHCNSKVRSQLVIFILFAGSEKVFVNASAVYNVWVYHILTVLTCILRDKKASLEVLLHQLFPFFQTYFVSVWFFNLSILE
ncbi:hypothetical protein CLUG_04513 [Clavispora lusitaniae ATCC 42720]|uniref:Uncharacterized protein n=1 Tax=Clavispora lusitaniae (strain ATCC 42720) TaxID=306902 RepID=C4Y8I5_CLAL4|nr:uncharacterized protein CLUG_04513 [Clavispora lusitaniae ATCC 42720]EEQ40384.1 hypothetical protein CLUG_04513 [Clavispora lusitaniae ATCC 42720]